MIFSIGTAAAANGSVATNKLGGMGKIKIKGSAANNTLGHMMVANMSVIHECGHGQNEMDNNALCGVSVTKMKGSAINIKLGGMIMATTSVSVAAINGSPGKSG